MTNNYLLYMDKKSEKLILVYNPNYFKDIDASLSRFWDGVTEGTITSDYLEDHCELVAWDLSGMVGEDEDRKLRLIGE